MSNLRISKNLLPVAGATKRLTIDELADRIDHRTDGPLSPFVIIHRACKYVEEGRATGEVAANAIAKVLLSFGMEVGG